jgi:hypothetical protein
MDDRHGGRRAEVIACDDRQNKEGVWMTAMVGTPTEVIACDDRQNKEDVWMTAMVGGAQRSSLAMTVRTERR